MTMTVGSSRSRPSRRLLVQCLRGREVLAHLDLLVLQPRQDPDCIHLRARAQRRPHQPLSVRQPSMAEHRDAPFAGQRESTRKNSGAPLMESLILTWCSRECNHGRRKFDISGIDRLVTCHT